MLIDSLLHSYVSIHLHYSCLYDGKYLYWSRQITILSIDLFLYFRFVLTFSRSERSSTIILSKTFLKVVETDEISFIWIATSSRSLNRDISCVLKRKIFVFFCFYCRITFILKTKPGLLSSSITTISWAHCLILYMPSVFASFLFLLRTQ